MLQRCQLPSAALLSARAAELLPPTSDMLKALAPFAPPLSRFLINNADTW